MSPTANERRPLDEVVLADAALLDDDEDDTTTQRPVPRDPAGDDVPTGRLVERAIRRSPSRGARRRLGSATTAQEAEIYDAVVVPEWRVLFGEPLLARVPRGFRGQILDVSAGTGYPSLELLDRMDPASRVVAIEADAGLLDLLKRRSTGVAGKRLFARAEELSVLSFGDEVFDLVLACAFPSLRDRAVHTELRRVMVPGGRLLAALPLAGTFREVAGPFRELAARRGSPELAARVEALAARDPDEESLSRELTAAGFDRVSVETLERTRVFRSAHHVFTDAVIRHVALAAWRVAAGFEPGAESILAELEEALAAAFPGGPVTLTVRVGIVEARRP